MLAGLCGLVVTASGQSSNSPPPGPAATPGEAGAPAAAATNAPAEAASTNAAPTAATNGAPPVVVEDTGGDLMFNFHGAPLNAVLEYMSDAAGFIINNQGEPPSGKVELWSKKPVTKDEAVDLLDAVLRKNKYAVSRNDRILTIYKMDSVRTSPDFPVRQVLNWEDVENNDDVGTFVIPVHYVSATQLKMNLQVLLPLDTELSVNESANSLVMVAPGRDVRRALKIVNALDTSVANNSVVRVFKLKYADAKQLASEITTLFTQNAQGGGLGGFGGRAAAFMALMRGGGGGRFE